MTDVLRVATRVSVAGRARRSAAAGFAQNPPLTRGAQTYQSRAAACGKVNAGVADWQRALLRECNVTVLGD